MNSEGDAAADDGGREPVPGSANEDSVTLEQLHTLLGYGHEMQTLDYKQSCDLDDPRAVVELAKDVAAMQIDGGWIVIGADDAGVPVPPGVPARDRKKFDEANLRPKLAKYLPEPFELHTAVHTIGDCTFAVIRVVPRSDGFCVFAKDGTYDAGGGKQKFVFHHGEVFARHGTTNERWNQSDIDRIRRNLASTMKEAWWAEREEDQRRRDTVSRGARDVVGGPVANYTWRIDADTFDAATLELLRAEDDIPLRQLFNEAHADAAALIAAGGDLDDLNTIVGRVTSVAAQAVTYRRPSWFREALDVLGRIYRLGFDQQGYNRTDGTSEEVWLITIEHVLGLGALAVRQRDWDAVRVLATTHPGGAGEYYPSWLRHGLTMAARSHRLDDAKSLVTRAAERIAQLPALRPDITATDNQVITTICQFDLLAVLTIMGATNSVSGGNWYPNFARFRTSRSEPAVRQLLADTDMRAVLFPLPDDALAQVLREVDRRSRIEGSRYSGWDGFETPAVENFLKANVRGHVKVLGGGQEKSSRW